MSLSPAGIKRRTPSAHERSNQSNLLDKFGVLQPQEVTLGLLGEYVEGDDRVWSGGLVHLLGDLGFSVAAARVALNRVIARGLLAPVKEGRFVFYAITPRLKLVHEEGRRQTFSATAEVKWTGSWTLVWYDSPEQHRAQRARLGRWLSLRGFGALQDGMWISPRDCQNDVIRLTERLGFREHVVVFGGKLAASSDIARIVSQGWKIKELKAMYEAFVKQFAPHRKQAKGAALAPHEAFVVRTRLIEMFRTTTMLDPQLSDEVLGIKWRRREAVEIFQELQRALFEPAATYFRNSAQTP